MAWDTVIIFFLNGFLGRSAWGDAIIGFFAVHLSFIAVVWFLWAVWHAGRLNGERWRIFFGAGVAVVLARGIITPLIRFFIHQPRPFAVLPVQALFFDSSWSLPSGHAAFFFALSAAVYAYDKKIGVTLFLVSALIGVGRIAAGVHYPTDILAGLLVGLASGYVVVRIPFLRPRVMQHLP
ncbi:MAG: phosphatase PAP2 family protein [bacterium]|nr:phosphatase PAP2 family protein [bacterium]MDZ4299881.1 phosphatase PAP2 family protein [Candidatus Sungbacteria bacterium]